MRIILASLMLASGAQAQGTKAKVLLQEGQASLAAAALQAPGLDIARLNHFFDAARAGLATLVASPTAAKTQSAQSFISPANRVLAPSRPLVVEIPAASPAYKRTFSQLLTRPAHTDQYDDLILKASYKHHLDARLLKAIIAAESSFSLKAFSPAGAHGLMQLMPATAREMGVDPKNLRDPEQNIAAGAAYMARLFQTAWKKYKLKGVRFHDVPQWLVQRIIAAYNAGPRFLFRDGFYPETRAYVRKVLLFYQSAVTDLRRAPRAPEYPTLSLPAAALN